ncbi:hypothetical protein H0A36_07470 [Endozoicomonas sp. SM1973]|uniref:Uncharacterized protein n=1 Tax=Spartinivicinus marinus TaxID=2994442 RepID=A0A853HVR6_9GAMM|nr:hypothetical protein [Spartinivicinus marinus]MCX4029242.1 hypothetical protein [Spartinivicinus marinus]NYZ65850.1 hypothetical protein [Spartinivicinus marinus]
MSLHYRIRRSIALGLFSVCLVLGIAYVGYQAYIKLLPPFNLSDIEDSTSTMNHHLFLQLSSGYSVVDVIVNGLFFTRLATIEDTGFGMRLSFNEFLVKGENQIDFLLVPNGPLPTFLANNLSIKIFSKHQGQVKNHTEKVVSIKDLEKASGKDTYHFRLNFKYDGFDLSPWLAQLSPLTEQEAISFAKQVVQIINDKNHDALMNVFYVRGKIYAQAYSQEFEKDFGRLARTIQETFIKNGLEKSVFEDKEFVVKPYFNNKVYSIFIVPDYTLDINKHLTPSDQPRDFLVSRPEGGSQRFNMEVSIAKFQGKYIFFI